jgi:integrase
LFNTGLQDERAHLQPVAETVLYTGMRKRELFQLQPEHVNFASKPISLVIKGETWVVPPNLLIIVKTKKGVPRLIPMSQRVRGILQSLCEDATCGIYVFSSPHTGKQSRTARRLGLRDLKTPESTTSPFMTFGTSGHRAQQT